MEYREDTIKIVPSYVSTVFPFAITINIKNEDQLREMYWRFFMDFRHVYKERGLSTEGIDIDITFGTFIYMALQEKLKKMKINPLLERKE